jgi:signal transduction histidine kinase/ActR/RegA family two-component response regulator
MTAPLQLGGARRRRYDLPSDGFLMQRLSIARSLRLALIGLTLALAVVAGLGLAGLYGARQDYEDTLTSSSSLATAAANLLTAGIAEAEVLRDARGPGAAAAKRQAVSAYQRAGTAARTLASSDPVSARLLSEQLAAEARARRLASQGRLMLASAPAGPLARARILAARLESRQQVRQSDARSHARSRSRDAVILVAIAGLLALLGTLVVISSLVRTMRGPLEELVQATRHLAQGDLERRVKPSGPRELRELGNAFNVMAGDLRAAQLRLEAERHRLEVTIESLGDGLIVTEPGSPRIAAVNPRAGELVPELGVGDSVKTDTSPLPSLEQALAGETIVEHAGRTLAVTASRLGEESGGVVWTVRDTTERARLERAKSDFVATASHELRSPLTSIKGFVELLHRSPEGMSERQREFVDIVLRSTDRLTDLVNDLLDVARIEADSVEINRRPIDVGEAVREVTELMGPRIAEKRQYLGVHVAPTVPLALADPGRVRQIIANLVTNAHLYTADQGRIQVAVEPDRAWVQIEVRDSGVGMTREQTARIFERFYRAREGGTTSPGTGLGLSIVKSLVELHHGHIEVGSEPGKGTTFRVRLPAAVLDTAPARMLDAIRGRRVLVVDDEWEIAELIAGQLEPVGVQTVIASDGDQALSLLRQSHFDAITLDVLMPRMNGFEVLREVRADPELRATPIVFVSVFSHRQELAGEWVVPKPIDADELRNVLAAAVQAGRSRVLVVGREELRRILEPSLYEFGIEYQWELTGAAAARVCAERRFEIALVDVGVRNPQAVLQAIDLRGRRLRRAAILVSDGGLPSPPGVDRLGLEVVPIEQAARAVLAALQGPRAADEPSSEAAGGASASSVEVAE